MLLAAALALAPACDGDGPSTTTATVTPPGTDTAPPSATATGTQPPVEPTASTGALAIEELPLIEFERADGSVVTLPVEVPPRSEYGLGLSGRYELGERGMLFHYLDDESVRAFYMRNTHIDLDIAFARSNFEVIAIETMTAESLDLVRPEQGFQYAIEAPAGWYAEHGIEVGDRVRITFELPDD